MNKQVAGDRRMVDRRSDVEIIRALREYLEKTKQKTYYKSHFREVDVNPDTALKWFKVIEEIQKTFPPIKVTEKERNAFIDVEWREN